MNPRVSRTHDLRARFAVALLLVVMLLGASPIALAAGTLNGQLWFVVQGNTSDIIDGHVNSDGSNITTTFLNIPAVAGAGFQQGGSDLSIGLDLPNGLYFVVNSDGLSISVQRITTGALVDTLQIANFNTGPSTQEIVNSLAVDPINHYVYAGIWGNSLAESGVIRISYTTAGALDHTQAYNSGSQTMFVNGSQAGSLSDLRYMDLSNNNQVLYVTDNDNHYSVAPFSPKNGIYKVDLTNPAAGATLLSSQAQFPTDLSNGLLGSVTADEEDGIIYFTTHQFNAGGTSTGQDALWWMPIAGGTATKITLPAGALHYAGEWGGLSYDRQTAQLYISDEDPTANTVANPTAGRHIIQLQMSADGKSVTGTVNTHTVDALVGHTADPNAYSLGSAFDLLPVFTKTDVGAHAVEQVAEVDIISSPTITDADGDHLAGATIVVTNGFVGSGDDLFVLDGATHRTTGTFTGTSITVSRTTDGSGNQTVTLTGYDTFAHYQTVLDAARFFANGDNPTNYGANTTRTIRWTASDGAPNVPFGGQNSGATIITIDAVNDAPVNALPGATPSGNEDTNIPITGLSVSDVDADPANQNLTVTLTVTNGTLTLLTNVSGGLVAGDITGNGTGSVSITATANKINATLAAVNGLVYKGVQDYFGPDTLQIVTNDNGHTGSGGSLTDTDNLGITVNPVNDPPSFTKGTDQTVNEDAGAQTASNWATNISFGPANESPQTVSFIVNNITYSSAVYNTNATFFTTLPAIDGSTGTLTYQTAPNANGDATVTIVAKDNGGTANGGNDTSPSQTFVIHVTAVNDAPSFTKGADQTVNEDAGAQTVNPWATGISAGPQDEAGQALTFNVTNNTNTALFSVQPAVSSAGVLTYTPAANTSGSATITVTLQDNGATANGGSDTSAPQTFTITVNPVNDAPTLDAISDPAAILEDAGQQTINLSGISAGPANENSQTLTVTATSNNHALIPDPTVTYTSPNATGSLSYTPVTNGNGSAVITVKVQDNGGTANGGVDTFTRTFNVNVTAVNDKPTFTATNPPAVNEDSGAQTVTGWAVFSPGPSDESSQAVSAYTVSNVSNPSLFSAAPSVATNGNLTYTPAAGAFGTSTFDVKVQDNGGTANGGVDTSDTQTFTVTINPLPSFSINDVTHNEGNSGTTSFTFTITKTGTTGIVSSVNFATQDGSAVAPGDYQSNSGTLNFQPADTTMTVTVLVNGDTTEEPDETFTVHLSSPTNATISDADGTGTIKNDDNAPVFSINNVSHAEGNSGTTDYVFTVTKTGVTAFDTSVDFTTQDGTATIADNDYQANSGTLTFAAAETTKTITVKVNGDTKGETDETFSVVLSNALGATTGTGGGVGTIQNDDESATAGQLIISEFRLRGPADPSATGPGRVSLPTIPPADTSPEANDEFIELYNNTDSPLLVATTDNSKGWALAASDGVVRFIVPNGTVIPARAHFLGVNNLGYSLSLYPHGSGDAILLADGTPATGYTLDIPDNAGIALFRTATPANFSTSTRLDAVGSTAEANTLYKEGAGYAALAPADIAQNLQSTFFRKTCDFQGGVCAAGDTPKDSDNNAADFFFADTHATPTAAGQLLGAPGPQNTTAPLQRNATLVINLLDSTVPPSAAPNLFRDPTPNTPNANTAAFGTVTIRRRILNNTGGDVTELRFRVAQLTTAPSATGDANLRAITSSDVSVSNIHDTTTCVDRTSGTASNCTVSVKGTLLEQPPNQTSQGGGFNSAWSVDLSGLPGGKLSANQSVEVQMQFGMMGPGNIRFYLNVEALP